MMGIPSDSTLIQGFISGSEASFEQLVERYESQVFRLALHLTRDQNEAEQVLQEVFVRLHSEAKSIKGRSVATWVHRAVLRVILDTCVAQVRLNCDSVSSLQTVVFKESSIASVANKSRVAENLGSAVDKLPDEYRQVFLLRDVAQLSNIEISHVLSLPLADVRARLYRARLMLYRAVKNLFVHAKKESGVIASGEDSLQPSLPI